VIKDEHTWTHALVAMLTVVSAAMTALTVVAASVAVARALFTDWRRP